MNKWNMKTHETAEQTEGIERAGLHDADQAGRGSEWGTHQVVTPKHAQTQHKGTPLERAAGSMLPSLTDQGDGERMAADETPVMSGHRATHKHMGLARPFTTAGTKLTWMGRG